MTGDLRLVFLLCALAACCSGCAATPPPSARSYAPPDSGAATFIDDAAALTRYHSRRLGLSLPLPGGRSWRIDDHSRPVLVATHSATRSALTVALFRTDALVGRTQCESLAREQKLLPEGDLRTLEDDVALTQETFDTRVWVAIEPGGGPDRRLAGYVMAFGGFLRKCFAFVFSTQVESASQESALSSRLAYVRARILGGLELDVFASVPRDAVTP